MSGYGILVNGEVELVDDVITWARWFESADRVVAKTIIGATEVSTVFLGLNQNIFGALPLWFETMVFGDAADQQIERYATLEEAMLGHERMVQFVQEAPDDDAHR